MYSPDMQIFVYDVDREGGTVVHYACCKGDNVQAAPSVTLNPPGYWPTAQRMHEECAHDIRLAEENEAGQVWVVRLGEGNFDALENAMKYAILMAYDEREREVTILNSIAMITNGGLD